MTFSRDSSVFNSTLNNAINLACNKRVVRELFGKNATSETLKYWSAYATRLYNRRVNETDEERRRRLEEANRIRISRTRSIMRLLDNSYSRVRLTSVKAYTQNNLGTSMKQTAEYVNSKWTFGVQIQSNSRLYRRF